MSTLPPAQIPNSRRRVEAKPSAQHGAGGQRALINFWLDVTLLLAMLLLIWTSVVVRYVFPPGPVAAGWRLWGRTYDEWSGLQFGLMAVLTFGVLIHVMLHWSWVCAMVVTHFGRKKGERIDEGLQTIYGVGFLIVLLGVLGFGVALAALMIQPSQ